MSYFDTIRRFGGDAEQLELAYQGAVQEGETTDFAQALETSYAQQPDNPLYAAWHYRLAYAVADKARGWAIAWGWVIPLALLNGLILWWLSDDQQFIIQAHNASGWAAQSNLVPHVVLLAAPISSLFVMLYLSLAGRGRLRWLLAATVALALLSAYVLLLYPQTGPRVFQSQYITLMVMNLALLAWTGVGVLLVAGAWGAQNRFAFLIKSLEVMIVGGLFAIAGGLFTAITFGLFDALSVEISILVQRLFFAGGGGLLPVLATAIIYNPSLPPQEQAFDEGLSKLIALLMRVLLPLSLLVLLIYIGFIPFNLREPFENRDVLIIYNGMLFAVMALLVGATPVRPGDLPGRLGPWLRRGIIAVALLAVLISLYALAAILYRTWQDRLTPNRLAFIGWNVVNIGILLLLLARQWRAGRERWVAALHSAFGTGAVAYVVWAVAVILVTPWMFGIDQGDISQLPVAAQRIVDEQAYPILFKCSASPHIYLLEKGEKRWIKDIPTFDADGFQWRDVNYISCNDLGKIPDGPTIPPDAGPPPQP